MTFLSKDYDTATEEMKCDASEDFMRRFFEGELKDLNAVGIVAYHLRKKVIKKGEAFVTYKFVDEDSGEVYELNAGGYADRQMTRLKLYPEMILNCE